MYDFCSRLSHIYPVDLEETIITTGYDSKHHLLHNLQLSWQWADIHVGWVAQNPFLAQLSQLLESARFLQPEKNEMF